MADLTQGAVDSLVGLLSSAIKDEARLIGGIQGDMQFIKDEMESMNGFLLHLTKTDGEHDDQLRAWMKQIRDIAYIAQDCIVLYNRDFAAPPSVGLWALHRHLRHLWKFIWTCPARHDLAKRISELKVRVRDVGERRQRYDVGIPRAMEPQQRPAEDHPSPEDMDNFLRALARDKKKKQQQQQQEAPSFDEAIGLLHKDLQSEATTVHADLKECLPQDHATHMICFEMLLRALFRARSQVRWTAQTKQELKKLVKKGQGSANLPHEVMVFCYSKLSRSYKSCLQYLSAFRQETAISRTSLVRRWVAEGLVEKQYGDQSLEEAAEQCFERLLFRGFLLPCDKGTAGKVKSCTIDDTVWAFVFNISSSENFVSDLPTHLNNQLRIRDFVKQQELQQNPRPHELDGPRSICGFRPPRTRRQRDDITATDPMDEMVRFLESLPQNYYRLNVLDLGGCKGVKKSHLKSICNVVWLKYLSLRNTNVSQLPKQINNLILIETLDIRQTEVRRDTKHIFLPNLKHLLSSLTMTENEEPLCARMPGKIGMMKHMNILSWVEVQHVHDHAALEEVGRQRQLRKLGVVLGGSMEAQENMNHLLRAIIMLSECLRSLSVCITPPPTNGEIVQMKMEQEHNAPKYLESLNISGLGNTGLPSWILNLQQLSKITLSHTLLSTQSLQVLGKKLQHLRCLRLRRNSYSECKLTFSKDAGFQALRYLLVEGDTITTIAFEEDGEAPMLEKIVWRSAMDLTMAATLTGIHRLKRLKEVELKGNFINLSSIDAAHPNCPTIKSDPYWILIEGHKDTARTQSGEN